MRLFYLSIIVLLLQIVTSPLMALRAAPPLSYSVYLPTVIFATPTESDDAQATEAEGDRVAALTPAFSADGSTFLRTQGQQIVDGSGQVVFLRGLNMDGYYYFDESTWPDAQLSWYAGQKDIRYLDRLGATALRLVLHWKYFESDLGYQLIDQYLAWCEKAGIYLILDMHVVPPDESFGEERIWNDPAAQQQLIELWQTIAQRYYERTAIAGFDLYNEPRPPAAQQWWNLAERIAIAIRQVDANHMLIVETPTWPAIELQLLNDSNVLYSYHDYEPFQVTHAGITWGQDSPVPSDYRYPGKVLTGLRWVGYAADAAEYIGNSRQWIYWDSGPLTLPATGSDGAPIEWATLKPYAAGNTGTVYIDDLEFERNGVKQTVYNGTLEEASPVDSNRPRYWYFYAPDDSSFAGAWGTKAHTGARSLQLTGSKSFGAWLQNDSYFTAPLFRVQRGDTFRVKGWIYAAENRGGTIGLSLDYLSGNYETVGYAQLAAYLQPVLDWAEVNNVPLYVGEFGAMPNAPAASRKKLLQDKIKLMNAHGVHWSLWTYRTPGNEAPSFGLYRDKRVDNALVTVLRQGLRR